MKQLRILLADDHEMVRRGLRSAIEDEPGWSVCGEAATGRQAVELARQLKPDVVVMDFSMPELNGLEATRQIHAALPRTEVLILTMHESEELVRGMLAAGARGIILKSDAGHALVSALRAFVERKPFFSPKISAMVLEGYLHPQTAGPSQQLTPREREIIQLIAEGRSTKETAERLGIAPRTADTHRTNIMRKLKLHSASDLTRFAIRNRIIQP
jgi:DNA-binding NarL/FixJ family response regulator